MEISHCGSLITKMIGQADLTNGEVQDCYNARSMPRKRRRLAKSVKSSRRHVKRKVTMRGAHETGRRGKSVGRGRSRSRGKSVGRGRSHSRVKLAGKSKIRCMRAGPVMNNGFLNFMREFRRKNCGLRPRESFVKGGQEWKNMSPECKAKYIRKAKRESRKRTRSGKSASCK